MVRLYEELGRNRVVMTSKCNPNLQIMIFTFEKRCMSRKYKYTMKAASDNERLVGFLCWCLQDFMQYYKVESGRYNYIDRLWDRAIEKS